VPNLGKKQVIALKYKVISGDNFNPFSGTKVVYGL